MREIRFNGYKNYPLNLYVWDEIEAPIGVVQLSHGMAEYLGRYDEFAKFLNTHGYIVLGDDHRGHGKTCGINKLGIVPEGDCFADTVADMEMITDYAKETYKLPVFLFGHSYGSFLAQRYLQVASDKIQGCVLCGSAKNDGADVAMARFIAKAQCDLLGKDKPAKLIRKLSFGMYDSGFKGEGEFAWGNRIEGERTKYLADPMCNFTLSCGFYKYFFNGLKLVYKTDELAKINKTIKLFIISGDQDPVGKYGKLVTPLFDMYKDNGMQNVSIKLYRNARHELLNEENKEEVFADILNFLQKTE